MRSDKWAPKQYDLCPHKKRRTGLRRTEKRSIPEEEPEREGGRGERAPGTGQRGWPRGEDPGKSLHQWGVWTDNRGPEAGLAPPSPLAGEAWRASFSGHSADAECHDTHRTERGQPDAQMARAHGSNWPTAHTEQGQNEKKSLHEAQTHGTRRPDDRTLAGSAPGRPRPAEPVHPRNSLQAAQLHF